MVKGGFDILLLEDAEQFLGTLSEKAQKKVIQNMRKVAGGVKDSKLFKKLEGGSGLWEFRTLYNGMQYRFLAFWDNATNSLVVVTHGFVKKQWEVSQREINRADELRKKYYESK